MRVAIDAAPLLDPHTGIARYTAEIAGGVEALGQEVIRFAVSRSGRDVPGIVRWRVPARVLRSIWVRTGRPPIERLTGAVDVVHATNFVLPPLRAAAGVVTIHDLSFLRDDTWPGGHRLRDLVPWSIERAARVIVPTKAIATEVRGTLGLDGSRIHVTPEGVSPVFFGAVPLADGALAEMGITRPFLLAVGTIEPRKNLPRLLKAWGSVRTEMEGWSMVLAGPRGWGPDLPETAGVVLPGWVGDETLPGLFAAASVFCYPSHYEGFGLPPLEAMAAGAPVVAGAYSAAEEVLGDAAVLVDPGDTEALAGAIIRVASDEGLRADLRRAGKARAARYTWASTALATMDAYRSALDSVG